MQQLRVLEGTVENLQTKVKKAERASIENTASVEEGEPPLSAEKQKEPDAEARRSQQQMHEATRLLSGRVQQLEESLAAFRSVADAGSTAVLAARQNQQDLSLLSETVEAMGSQLAELGSELGRARCVYN